MAWRFNSSRVVNVLPAQMTRVHREPLVPRVLFDFLLVPDRDEGRNDNASTSPTVEDESESGRRDVPARHCEVVVEKDSWLARPGLKRVDMATQKIFHTLIEEEFQIQSTRVGTGDQKARQAPTGPANGHFAKVRPIDLSLLSWKEAQSQKGLRANRPQTSYHTPQLHHASGVTALPDHLVDARGAQPRILL